MSIKSTASASTAEHETTNPAHQFGGKPPVYGWVVVFTMMLIQTVSSGLGFYNMSVYINRLSEELVLPLAQTSLAVTIYFIVSGIGGLFVAHLLQRFSIRLVMIGGALIAATALGSIGMTTELWQLYALFAIYGFGSAGISVVMATTVTTQWFPGPERSMALALTSTGFSLGGVVVTPVSAYWLNAYGLAEAMPMLGVLLLACVVPLSVLMRPSPFVASQASGEQMADNNANYRRAVGSRFFILMAVAYVLIMSAQVGGIAHIYSRVQSVAGFEMAAYAVQALSISSISGRLLGAWMVARVSTRWFALGNITMQAFGLAMIALAPSGVTGVIAACCFGLCVGNLLMTQALWLAEVYPAEIYPRVFARASAISVVGMAFGPFLLGWTFDHLGHGSYTLPYLLAASCSVIALLVVFVASAGRPMSVYRL